MTGILGFDIISNKKREPRCYFFKRKGTEIVCWKDCTSNTWAILDCKQDVSFSIGMGIT